MDNALGRFFGIDLLSEDYVSFSPMHFGLNNPISLNDLLGLKAASGSDNDSDFLGGFSGTVLDEVTVYGEYTGINYTGFDLGSNFYNFNLNNNLNTTEII